MTPTTAQSLYRAWRSRTFEEVVGQGHITQTLRNAVRAGAVGHAYLLTGPRGTGKTSTARILARAVNCLHPRDGEPCNECPACVAILQNRCLDIVEIDAASNNSVDDMRDLRDKVNFAPAEVKRKAYIIDEAHMLSTSAFNALLKTLEEPPAHVLFLLATTDVHKVPATITSRCQRLDFRAISTEDIVDRLAYVCEREGMQAERGALEIIARQATGSLRDALSLLEQVRAYEEAHIGVAEVEDALGLARRETLARLTDSIADGDAGAALALIGDLAAAGTDMRQYAKQMVQYWRDLLLLRVGSAHAGRGRAAASSDPAMAAQAERLAAADITAVLKAILQPDYSGRRSASAQWQLELAVVEASAHFAAGEARSAEPGTRPGTYPSRERGADTITAPTTTRTASEAAVTSDSPAAMDGSAPASSPSTGRARAARSYSTAPSPSGVVPDGAVDRRPAAGTNGEAHGGDGSARASDQLAAPAAAADLPYHHDGDRAAAAQAPTAPGAQPGPVIDDARRVWARVRQHQAVKGRARLNALLDDSCVPGSLDDGSFVLLFDAKNKFRQDQVMAQQNRVAIEEALLAVVGRPVTLRCDTLRQQSPPGDGRDPSPSPSPSPSPKADPFVDEAARRLRAIHVERQR